MSGAAPARVLAGYDGSPAAGAAIELAARLLPGAFAWIVNLWGPPYTSDALHRRLWSRRDSLNDFVEALEREGAAEATRIAAAGAVLARATGWTAEPVIERAAGGEGLQFDLLAEKLSPDVAVLGSRGLGGLRAVLGSVSDMVVHYARCPVLVVPHPLLAEERTAVPAGPVIVGWDDSPGSRRALTAAEALFPGRTVVVVGVHDGGRPLPPPAGHEFVEARPRHRPVELARGVAEALAEQARVRRAAVVVVGSRGRQASEEILLGSAAMATLHHAFRPVLVVPHAGPLPDGRRTSRDEESPATS